MTTPISFTVRPPAQPSSSHRPQNGHRGAPSRRLFESEDHSDDEDRMAGRQGGRREKESRRSNDPLVIPAIPNRDWRQSSQRRVPSYRPEERQDRDVETHERTGDGPQKSGLRYAVKTETGEGGIKVETMIVEKEVKQEVTVKSEPLSLEEEALRAILAGDQPKETEEERQQRELVIAAGISEEDAYKRDVAALPEESTLDDYDAVPVSAFGLAMARGMGWDPKGDQGTSLHVPKQRPQLLGLGATPMDPTVKPTHGRDRQKKKEDRAKRGGRGYIASGLLVKRERDDTGTPTSGREDDSEGKRSRANDDAEREDRYGNGGRDHERRKDESRRELPRDDYSRDRRRDERDRDNDRARRQRPRDDDVVRERNGRDRHWDDRDRRRDDRDRDRR